jgi:hypothetical protein
LLVAGTTIFVPHRANHNQTQLAQLPQLEREKKIFAGVRIR